MVFLSILMLQQKIGKHQPSSKTTNTSVLDFKTELNSFICTLVLVHVFTPVVDPGGGGKGAMTPPPPTACKK